MEWKGMEVKVHFGERQLSLSVMEGNQALWLARSEQTHRDFPNARPAEKHGQSRTNKHQEYNEQEHGPELTTGAVATAAWFLALPSLFT